MRLVCEDHGDQLVPNDGPSRTCGLCGQLLYQSTLLNECHEEGCGFLVGVIQTRKWIGDAWVVDPDDAAEVRPAVERHYADAHGEVRA